MYFRKQHVGMDWKLGLLVIVACAAHGLCCVCAWTFEFKLEQLFMAECKLVARSKVVGVEGGNGDAAGVMSRT